MSDVYIIAEIGSCYRELSDCTQSISIAAACGANAVKFQHFSHQDLFGFPAQSEGQDVSGIPEEWFPQLREKADACKVDLIISAFSEEGVDRVDPFVHRHKIAGSESCWLDFVSYVGSKGKPVIATVGHMSPREVEHAYGVLRQWLAYDKISLLYGDPIYPTLGTNLQQMVALRKAFPHSPIGFSDHSREPCSLAQAAVMLGADVIEKHVQFVDGVFPDSAVATDKDGFAALCKLARGYEGFRFQGYHQYRMKYRRRLIATQDLMPGDKLKMGVNYGVFRSKISETNALHPNMNVDGATVTQQMPRGSGIQAGCIDGK
jgi:sialic acid synthase SpsE